MQCTRYAYAQGINTQPSPAVNNVRTCILSYPAKAIMFVNWQYLFFPLFFLLWTHIKVKEKMPVFSLCLWKEEIEKERQMKQMLKGAGWDRQKRAKEDKEERCESLKCQRDREEKKSPSLAAEANEINLRSTEVIGF